MNRIWNLTVTALLILGCVLTTIAWTGCSKIDHVVDQSKALLVDCTKQATRAVVSEIGPLVESTLVAAIDPSGKVDWSAIKSVAPNWTAEIGGCALADVVSRLLKPTAMIANHPQIAPLQVDLVELRTGFDAFKSQTFGGVVFQLANGAKL